MGFYAQGIIFVGFWPRKKIQDENYERIEFFGKFFFRQRREKTTLLT